MICPNCLTQMHQEDKIGGGENGREAVTCILRGESREDYYETWETKECPSCGREVKEFYSVMAMNKKETK